MGSKLSLHLNIGTRPSIWPSAVLLLDPSAEWVNEVYNASPKTLIVARHNFDAAQPLNAPEQNARDAYAKFRARALATRGRAYWQLYNETATDSADGMAALNRFTLEAMNLAEADGVKLAILAASTGTPLRPDENMAPWTAFLPSVRRAISGGHVLVVHEYGPRSVMEMQGWHVGRFKEARKYIPELAQVKTVITEIGIDGGSWPYNLPRSTAGWRNVPGLTADGYMAQLAEADALYADVPNVLGLCIFCVGSANGWQSFAIDPELWPRLASYWQANPPLYPGATVPISPPPPTTTPPPVKEPPVADPYSITPGFRAAIAANGAAPVMDEVNATKAFPFQWVYDSKFNFYGWRGDMGMKVHLAAPVTASAPAAAITQLEGMPAYNQLNDWTTDVDGTDENRANNCGPESLSIIIKWLTGVELSADWIKDKVKGPTYTGNTFVSPDLTNFLIQQTETPIDVYYPDRAHDIQAVIKESIGQGWPVCVLYRYPAGVGGALVNHFAVCYGYNDNGPLLANPWGGRYDAYTWAAFKAVYLSWCIVAQRPRDPFLTSGSVRLLGIFDIPHGGEAGLVPVEEE